MAGLDASEARFIEGVAARTGIDAHVLIAWADAEGAYAQNGTGHFNYLNLRQRGTAGASSAGFAWFANVNDAIGATVRNLQSPNYAGIRATVARPHETIGDQLAAIAQSPWDAGHYTNAKGTGGKLLDALAGRFPKDPAELAASQAAQGARAGSQAPEITHSVGTPSASDWTSANPIGSATGATADAAKTVVDKVTSVADAIGWVFTHGIRLAELFGGLALLVVGLSILSKQLGGPSLVPRGLPVPGRG